MSKLIVCLGYHLEPDGSISSILENRLKDTADLCNKNKNSILLLMGGFSYRGLEKFKFSEASLMKGFLEKNFNQQIKDINIITEENTTSTVEQLCYLKDFIKEKEINDSDLIIVSSEFFGNRVKLYAEYIFGIVNGIVFIESQIPKEFLPKFQEVEAVKLTEAQNWLKNHTKGDDTKILKEQKEFQSKVKKGEIVQQVS